MLYFAIFLAFCFIEFLRSPKEGFVGWISYGLSYSFAVALISLILIALPFEHDYPTTYAFLALGVMLLRLFGVDITNMSWDDFDSSDDID